MKVSVDLDWCQGNGLCVLEAPAVFSLAPEGKAIFVADVAEEQRAAVEAAVTSCPTQAITIID